MPDWSNPSEKDIQEAKEHGLDLTDPAVQVRRPELQSPDCARSCATANG